MNIEKKHKDKAIISGLFLAKFNELGLAKLGFNSFREAFNILGYSLKIKPSSIKNYRDEFDPLFLNNRKGWHKRPIRDYCKVFYEKYNSLNIEEFSKLIKSFIFNNNELEQLIYNLEKKDSSGIASKRLLTGKAAEHYFKIEYKKIECFKHFKLQDTTLMACGFDYKLSSTSNFYCIEVKGLNERKGGIQLTEKEFSVAEKMKEKYCLFVVTNFKQEPVHNIIFDPLNSMLNFKKTKREIIQTSYNTYI